MYKRLAFIAILGLGSLASAYNCDCDCHTDKTPTAVTAPTQLEVITPVAKTDKEVARDNAKPITNEVIHIKVLSSNESEATLKEIKDQPCRFLTSLCPDRCGHATRLAIFQITKYTQYKKEGEYGDPQQKCFYLDLNKTPHGQNPSILETLKTLKIGDKVKLNWEHYYITQGGASYPERPVKTLEKIKE